jgi:hypothetical protein
LLGAVSVKDEEKCFINNDIVASPVKLEPTVKKETHAVSEP